MSNIAISGLPAASTITGTELLAIVQSGVTSKVAVSNLVLSQSQITNLTTDLAGKQPSDSTLTALAGYNTNGILTQTAADTFTGRTLTGTSNRISITNGDGVSGDPTIDISSSYVGQTSITTLGTITSGTWNGTVIGPTYGGTGQSTYATGDILYASATNTLSKLSAGTNGYFLTLSSGIPTWAAGVKLSDFGLNSASNGECKLPNGLIMKWGSVSVTSGSTATITFPTTFPFTTVYNIQLSSKNGSQSSAAVLTDLLSFSTTTASIFHWRASGSTTSSLAVYWFAIGV